MLFFPYDYFEIYTNLTPQETHQRLSKAIEPWQLFSFAIDPPFVGEVVGNKFKMTRKTGIRNSFLPVISGEIFPDQKGSLIKISMRLDLVVFLVFVVLLVVFVTVLIGILSNWLVDLKQINLYKLIESLSDLGIFVFFYLFFLVPYKIEVSISKKTLFTMFEIQMKSR